MRFLEAFALLSLVACNDIPDVSLTPTLEPTRRQPPIVQTIEPRFINGAPDLQHLGPPRASWDFTSSDLVQYEGRVILSSPGTRVRVIPDPTQTHGFVLDTVISSLPNSDLGVVSLGLQEPSKRIGITCWETPVLFENNFYIKSAPANMGPVFGLGGYLMTRDELPVADGRIMRNSNGELQFDAFGFDGIQWQKGEPVGHAPIPIKQWTKISTLITNSTVWTYVDGIPTSRVPTGSGPFCGYSMGLRVFPGSNYDNLNILQADSSITVFGKATQR